MEQQDKSKSSKKRKYSENQSNMDDYHDSTELNEQRCTRINRALVKFFIACRIAFRIVEHSFFINFIKELNARYNIPTREVLVNQLLERELAQVNFKVNSELEKKTNLTLVFDGWTSSHQANAKLAQIIKEKGISGGGLKLYCKTCWTTASESVNSKFFSNLRVLGFVLDPLRKAVLSLELRRATLADCFLSLVRLAATLKKLPKSLNPAFRSHCIKVINERFDEFDDDKYITCFFMDLRFRNAPLKKCALMRIIKCAASIGKNLGFNRYKAETLCDQIQKYINEQEPFT
ncbi:ribonuclease H-like domain-containing protein [Rhizophagus irregularis DAOM 181602=DAOM 197198]|nr:ribonuclease H-like domain-containing protein [Rhizophagus irregularis DAOM 181602=DAOM 197198]